MLTLTQFGFCFLSSLYIGDSSTPTWAELPYGGLQGPTGPAGGGSGGGAGSTGATGATGVGVPSGGTSGQVLAKTSSSNYATQWVTLSNSGSGATGFTGATGPAGGVTSIVAGTNVTISPSNGLGAVTINASGGGGTANTGVYIIKLILGTSGSDLTTGMTVSDTRDPSAASLTSNGWTVTAPATAAPFGSAATGTYFQITYPSSFTGTFTNFRRYVYYPGPPVYYAVSNISVSSTSGQYVLVAPSTRTIVVAGMTTSFTGATVSTAFYFVFEYSNTNIIL